MFATWLLQAPQATIATYWWVTLAFGVVVVLVVAYLLDVLLKTAREIRSGVADIWGTGQRIAGNTVHIPMLERTNRRLEDVLESADATARASERLQRAAGRQP